MNRRIETTIDQPHWIAACGLATVVVLGFCLWFGTGVASAQGETAPSYELSDSTDLLDGQTINVSGRSFLPFARLFFHQCSIIDEFACAGLGFGTVEADGTFAIDITVERVLIGSQSTQTFDCAFTGCEIKMGAEGLRPTPIGISFDDSVEPPELPAEIAVSPAVSLTDGQLITVSIEDEKAARGEILQCRIDPETGFPTNCVNLSPLFRADSSFAEREVRVRRNLYSRPTPNAPDTAGFEPVDCASLEHECVLGFQRIQNRQLVFTGALDFDSTAPLLKPKVASTKRKGVAQGGSVTITISNSLDEFISVYQCPRSAEDHTDQRCRRLGDENRIPNNRSVPTLDPFTLKIEPLRLLGNRGEGRVDCSDRRACNLHLVSNRGPIRQLALRIAKPKRSTDLSIRVRTGKNLPDTAEVLVQVRNASAEQTNDLDVFQCPIGSDELEECLLRSSSKLKQRKRISSYVAVVVRTIGDFDCAAAVARCELRIFGSDVLLGSAPLHFAEGAPSASPQATMISELDGVQQGQLLLGYITGGFQNQVSVWQCLADSTDTAPTGCTALDSKARSVVSPNGTSRIWEFGLERTVTDVDCVATTSVCVLRFEVDELLLDQVFELQLDPGKAPKSQSSVTPTTGLSNGDTVDIVVAVEDQLLDSTTVEVCGFSDNKFLPSTCKNLLNVQEPGTYSVVLPRFLDAEGTEDTWDCASAPRACRILLLDGRITRFGLTFADTE